MLAFLTKTFECVCVCVFFCFFVFFFCSDRELSFFKRHSTFSCSISTSFN